MAAPKRCIICLNYLKSKKKSIPKHSVEEQSVIMYFLRKLAWTPISSEDLQTFLKCGNPSEWAALCYICEEEVKRCLDKHREVETLIGEMIQIRKKLYEENFYESEEEEEEEESASRSKDVASGGGRAVFNHLREQLFSDFKDGGQESWAFDKSISIIYKSSSEVDTEMKPKTEKVCITVKQEKVSEDEAEEEEDHIEAFDDGDDDDRLEDVVADLVGVPTVNAAATSSSAISAIPVASDDDEALIPDNAVTTCPKCKKNYSCNKAMRRHYSERHLNLKDYVCPVCSEAFSRKEYLKSHVELKHPGVEGVVQAKKTTEWSCQYCPCKFRVRRSLHLHIQEAHSSNPGKRYKFDQSNKVYKTNDEEAHVVGVEVQAGKEDTDERKFDCTRCTRVFITQARLNRHIRETHDKIKNFICSHCGKTSSRKSDLQRHMYIVHEKKKGIGRGKRGKPVKCKICSKICRTGSGLERHMRDEHDEEQTVVCDLCGRSYANKDSLAIHIGLKHKHNEDAGATGDDSQVQQEETSMPLLHEEENLLSSYVSRMMEEESESRPVVEETQIQTGDVQKAEGLS